MTEEEELQEKRNVDKSKSWRQRDNNALIGELLNPGQERGGQSKKSVSTARWRWVSWATTMWHSVMQDDRVT